MARLHLSLLLVVLTLGACAPEVPREPAAETTAATRFSFDWAAGREIHEPRLIAEPDGSLLMVWREKAADGSNIYVARGLDDGTFSEPVRVNDQPDTVESYPHDEMRAAVATGSGARLAVGWSDSRGQVRAAESSDGGQTFAPSLRLEQVEAASYRGFPDLAYGEDGALHAVWIDSRFAEGMAEEPADLFYARVVDGVVTELNLTAEQEPTICGCCRPNLEIVHGRPRALFRNSTSDGYRDIFTIAGDLETGFEAPTRVGAPLWKLRGCPMAGPMAADDLVIWPDGSTGRKLLMSSPFDDQPPVPLFAETEGETWTPRLSPRRVASGPHVPQRLLLPGQSASRLLSPGDNAGGWVVELADLPAWASSAYVTGNSLVLVGAVEGELMHEYRQL